MGMVQQFEHLDLPINFFQIDFVEFTFIDDFYGNLQKKTNKYDSIYKPLLNHF